jgi:AraC-like DNA-binding protein
MCIVNNDTVMRSLLVTVFLLGFSSNAFGQHGILDSLYAELKVHPQKDTTRIHLLNAIAINSWATDPEKTKDYATRALALAQELEHVRGTGDAYCGICRYYWSQTEFNKSMDFALMAVKAYEQCHYVEGISWCYGTIGLNYAQAHNYAKSIEYHSIALSLNKKIKNSKGISRDLNNRGNTYEITKDNRHARAYYQQALDRCVAMGNRADIICPLGNVGSANLYLGNYKLSLQYFFKALALAKEFNHKNFIALNYQNIGEASYKVDKYKDGEFYLHEALKVATEIGDKKRSEDTYEILTNLEESRKNYSRAFRYLKLWQSVRDTLYTEERSRQMAEMEARFETEKKEQAIQLLEKDKRIQTLWKNILIAGLVIVIISFGIVYQLLRYREKRNFELLNMQIDLLTSRQHDLVEKFKLAIFSSEDRAGETNDQRFLKKALEIVERNLADPLFGVEKMAAEMGMSRGNLHRKLKAITNCSPGDFIRGVRLKRAANLLRHQTDSVAQVGFTVGFEDQSYFSKSFKKQFGVSPTEYLRSAP